MRQSSRPGKGLALIPLIVVLTACATAVPNSPLQETTKETEMPSNASCTEAGAYLLIPSANGSFPLLPTSNQGADATPLVRLSSTHLGAVPPTVDVSVDLSGTGGPAAEDFNGLEIGQEASFGGYTIRISSICDKEVLFDLVSQPE